MPIVMYPDREKAVRQTGVELSVIAPMYNEEDSVESTIRSIRNTHYVFSK